MGRAVPIVCEAQRADRNPEGTTVLTQRLFDVCLESMPGDDGIANDTLLVTRIRARIGRIERLHDHERRIPMDGNRADDKNHCKCGE